MTPTPRKMRETRSNSQAEALLDEVKSMKKAIEDSERKVIETLKKDIENLSDTIKHLTTRVHDLESENMMLRNKCNELSTNADDLAENILYECEQRRRREANLFVVGIPELPTGSFEERQNYDRKSFEEVLDVLKTKNVTVIETRRAGRTSQKDKRPMIVKLADVDQKWKVLNLASSLRRIPRFKTVFLNADLTKRQQVRRKMLLTEQRERKDNGEDVIIFRNTVIPREQKESFFH